LLRDLNSLILKFIGVYRNSRKYYVFFLEYSEKILSNNYFINYLKYVCFGIGKRHFFELNLIDNDGDTHLLVDSEPKYTPSRVMKIIKYLTAKKSLNNNLILKTFFVW